jgi:hypothetical protein
VAWEDVERPVLSGRHQMGKGLLLWAIGIPIPVIILLFMFHVIH